MLTELLDHLLVLLHLLHFVNRLEVNTEFLGLTKMLLVSDHADGECLTRARGKLDGSAEALVLGRVIVLQRNLKLYGLKEVPLLLLRVLLDLLDGSVECLAIDFAVIKPNNICQTNKKRERERQRHSDTRP